MEHIIVNNVNKGVNKMIRWGVIGAGKIAQRFCKALSYDKRAKLKL